MSEMEKNRIHLRLLLCAGILFAAVLLLGANWFSADLRGKTERRTEAGLCSAAAQVFMSVLPESERSQYAELSLSSPELALRMNCIELVEYQK